MIGDTITVTINAVAKTLVKINQDKYSSEYRLREADGMFTLNIRHSSYSSKDGRAALIDRHNVELIHTRYATPTDPAKVTKTYTVFEQDRVDTTANPAQEVVGFAALFNASFVGKLQNYES